MIHVEDTVLVLLAAGQSRRFGIANKLEQDFLGKPVGLHVVTALESVPFKDRIAITDGNSLDYAPLGYHVIRNPSPERGMSGSVRLGAAAARDVQAKAVMIVLADMPRVTAAHIYRMFDVADSSDAIVASSDGRHTRPPALFGADQFDYLMALTGDAGARDLVKAGKHVVTAPAELIDIDTPEDLERLRALVHAPEALTRAGARRLG